MKVCFLRNDGSQIWAGDKEQILQDIEDNYSYEVAEELKREREYYENLEDGIISLQDTDLDSAYEDISYLTSTLLEIEEMIEGFENEEYSKKKVLSLLENIKEICHNRSWKEFMEKVSLPIVEFYLGGIEKWRGKERKI